MTSVLLDSITVTTDALAGLAVDNVAYTHAVVSWQNPSQTRAEFRVISEDGSYIPTSATAVEPGQTGQDTIFPLVPGTSTKFYLERREIDTWVRQTSTSSLDYALVSNPTTSMTVTSGSTTAKATFQAPVADADVWVNYWPTGSRGEVFSATVTISGSTGEALITGLTEGLTYDVALGINYPQHILDKYSPESTYQHLHSTAFTTSSNAEMVITGPFASYMGIDWSASVDGQGSNYRIVNRVNSSDDVLAASSTATAATIQDLQPGSQYTIVLQREELDGSWSDQNEVVANTLSSAMTISSVMSQTLEVSWQPLYSGANFEVLYTASGSTKASGQTQDTTTILRDLSPGTSYELNLVVYELGQAVGLARLGMTTNEGIASKLKIGAVALVVLLVAYLLLKKKK